MTPENSDLNSVPDARLARRRRPSVVWLIPLVAAIAGGFVAWRTFSELGPLIEIELADAEGLEAGKTKIRYKDVEVGVVEEIHIEPDLSGVICTARMESEAEGWLTEKTRFWVVRPRVTGSEITGLGTLFSGAYIGIDPVPGGKSAKRFTALEVPPIVTTDEPGKHFTLTSHQAGSVHVGAPVYFQQIKVGEVVASSLDPSGELVVLRIFVHAPHDQLVHTNTRFWNASGVRISIGADGAEIDVESLVSLLIGGIAFAAPRAGETPAADGATFELYATREATERPEYTQRSFYVLYFDQSVRGLDVGAPVEFRGIRIGEVKDVTLEFDDATGQFRIPVLVAIEPQRVTNVDDMDVGLRHDALQRLVRKGLRAQLQMGSLLTGQLFVELDMHEEAKAAEIVWSEPYPEFPTVPAALEEITSSVTQLAKRLDQLPLEQIATSLNRTLDAAQGTFTQVGDTLNSANALVGPDSPINAELLRTLAELTAAARSVGLAADQIESQPNSLIFGRGKQR